MDGVGKYSTGRDSFFVIFFVMRALIENLDHKKHAAKGQKKYSFCAHSRMTTELRLDAIWKFHGEAVSKLNLGVEIRSDPMDVAGIGV
jgi:hypothetical protein